jgi:hypothetical protein
MLVWGAEFRVYPEFPSRVWTVAGARITLMQLIILSSTISP